MLTLPVCDKLHKLMQLSFSTNEVFLQAPLKGHPQPWEPELWERRSSAQQRKETKHIVRQFAGLQKGLDLLRDSLALAAFNPWSKLALAYTDHFDYSMKGTFPR